MKREEMLSELKRMATFAREASELDAPEKAIYVAEIQRKFGWMDAAQFHETITWVIDHHRSRSLPQIPEIEGAVRALFERGVLKRRGDGFSCVMCDGTGWAYVRGIAEADHRSMWFCRPCQSCRAARPMGDPPDGIVIDDSRSFSPKQAAKEQMAEVLGIILDRRREIAEKREMKVTGARVDATIAESSPVAAPDPLTRIAVQEMDLSAEEVQRLNDQAEREGIPF